MNTLLSLKNNVSKIQNLIISGEVGATGPTGPQCNRGTALDVNFFGDLDAYTLQNIYRTLKAGSASSLIRNADFSAPDVKFLGVLPKDVKKYDLFSYDVKESDSSELRALKKA